MKKNFPHLLIALISALCLSCLPACDDDDSGTNSSARANIDKIVFVSDRDIHRGNSEIYIMDADGDNQTRLTHSGDNYTPKWSPDKSKIAFVSYPDKYNPEIYVMDADGSNQTRLTHSGNNYSPAWSPDGSKIAFISQHEDSYDDAYNIHVVDANGNNQKRLTESRYDYTPAWSPDGSKIAFASRRNGYREIYVMNSDGSNETRLTHSIYDKYKPKWSPDGSKIAFTSEYDNYYEHNGYYYYTREVYIMDADGSNQTRLAESQYAYNPAWSPDGSKIAFTSQSDGYYKIYIMDADGSNQTRLTKSRYHYAPIWSPDGSKIAFISGHNYDDCYVCREIHVIGADGRNEIRLTNNFMFEGSLDW